MSTTISCIIRTYNEAKFIGKLLKTLKTQEYSNNKVEIIVIDSGSTDDTTEIVRNFAVTLIEIPRAEFNYSSTLNLGIKQSTGDFIVILSAHSIPREKDWLRRMVSHFEDKKVAGVYCRQVPYSDADLSEVLRIRNTFGIQSKLFNSSEDIRGLNFSNAASCIRRAVWKEHPFVIMPSSEDREWAQWTTEKGYNIFYDAEVSVYHSHKDTCRQAAKRMIGVEKAGDILYGRHRNLLLTFKQACGQSYHIIKQSMLPNSSILHKIKIVFASITVAFWFIHDFYRKSN